MGRKASLSDSAQNQKGAVLVAFAGSRQAIDANDLTLVADIAAAGSLTSAARLAGLTQPALTRKLQRIEQVLGVALFSRSMRGVKPTLYGAALLPRARTIHAQRDQAMQGLAQLRGQREGSVTISISHLATIALLPAVIRQFRSEWPDVLVSIEAPAFPDRFAGLREGRPDFAVVPRPSEPLANDFVATPLHSTTVVAIARRGHALAGAQTLSALVGAQWVLPSLRSTSANALRTVFARARLPPPHVAVSCETLTGLEALVSDSDLLGIVPLEVQRQRASASGLVALPLHVQIEGPSLALIRWRDAQPTPAAARLAELFIRVARQRLTRRTSNTP